MTIARAKPFVVIMSLSRPADYSMQFFRLLFVSLLKIALNLY